MRYNQKRTPQHEKFESVGYLLRTIERRREGMCFGGRRCWDLQTKFVACSAEVHKIAVGLQVPGLILQDQSRQRTVPNGSRTCRRAAAAHRSLLPGHEEEGILKLKSLSASS